MKQGVSRALWGALACVFVFIALVIVSHLPVFAITKIGVMGTRTIDAEAVKSSAERQLQGSYGFLFPKRNFLLARLDDVREALLKEFSASQDVQVRKENKNSIGVWVSERQPFALWCGAYASSTPLEESGPCYFMDDEGYVFDSAPAFSAKAFFRYFGGINAENPIGSRFGTATLFKSLRKFVEDMRGIGLSASALSESKPGEYELIFLNDSLGPARILFSRSGDFAYVVENARIILSQGELAAKKLKEKNLAGVDYIDMRYGNKIYYKLR